MSAAALAQQSRTAELSKLTKRQLISRVLALEAAAAASHSSQHPSDITPSTTVDTPADNNDPTATATTRKHKRPHSDHSTSAEHLKPASSNDATAATNSQPLDSSAASPSPTASSSSIPLPLPPASPTPPPTKHQRLSTNPSTASATTAKATKAGKAGFDYWSYAIRHIAFRFLYVGTAFHGFSAQSNSTVATVESHLFHALIASRLITSRTSCHYQRCGRTDRGVHAGGQVISLWVRSRLRAQEDGRVPVGWVSEGKKRREREREERRAKGEVILIRHLEDAAPDSSSSDDDEDDSTARTAQPQHSDDEADDDDDNNTAAQQQQTNTTIELESAEWEANEFDYAAMLNRYLPPTIRILSYHPIPLHFSARFSCLTRTYHYLFFKDNLNIDAMRAAGELMCGKHDWRNFCTYDLTAVTHFIRRIHRVTIQPENNTTTTTATTTATTDSTDGTSDSKQNELNEVNNRNILYRIEIEGKAFLYHQIRCMVSILFAIGRNEESIHLIPTLLNTALTPHKPAYRMASEKGLILQDSTYNEFSSGGSGMVWPSVAISSVNLTRCYMVLFQQQRLLTMEAAVVGHMATAIHTQLLQLTGGGSSGLLSVLPFQLDDRLHKRWLCGGGELLRSGNLQRSFADQVNGLTGKKKERRQKVDKLREMWRRKEEGGTVIGDAGAVVAEDGMECVDAIPAVHDDASGATVK